MAYVKDTDILDATNGGLDIIMYYYPHAAKVYHKAAKRFKIRESEKTPSAALKKLENGVWVVTDFGGDRVPRNGIHVCALEEDISYAEACNVLGTRYNVKGAEIQPLKPIIERRALNPDESAGEYIFEAKDFTKEELAILGPRVNEVYCKEYSLVSLKSFTYCKENEAIITTSTKEYPIFMFDYGTWQKIYQPNSFDKQYRFRYAGTKPEKFMFGIDVIKKEFDKRKKKIDEESIEDFNEEEDSKKKKKKDPRLDAVFICSGGSDGLNLRSFEKYPIWFNSESEHLDWQEYKRLKIYAKEIYYMADLDSTGVKQAVQLGLKYLDVKLIWLPAKLKNYRDKRGNPRKDFKDYVETFYRTEEKTLAFQNGLNKIIDNALPLQFWTETYDKEGKYRYNVSNTRLYHFLEHLGFGRYESENLKDGYIFIRKEGNVVKVLEPYQIANFVHSFLAERGMSPDLRDFVYRSPQLSEKSFSNLPALKIDFTNANRQMQYMFFAKKILRITADSVMELKQGEIDNYVWEDKIIDFNIRKSDPHFKITTDKDGDLDIKVLKNDNMFFNFLINTSRVHWREELEESFKGKTQKEADEYYKANKFNISGPNLEGQEYQVKEYSFKLVLRTADADDFKWAPKYPRYYRIYYIKLNSNSLQGPYCLEQGTDKQVLVQQLKAGNVFVPGEKQSFDSYVIKALAS